MTGARDDQQREQSTRPLPMHGSRFRAAMASYEEAFRVTAHDSHYEIQTQAQAESPAAAPGDPWRPARDSSSGAGGLGAPAPGADCAAASGRGSGESPGAGDAAAYGEAPVAGCRGAGGR
ncbi:hypothetical protein ACWGJ0_22345 [Streptomyces massasporeus]